MTISAQGTIISRSPEGLTPKVYTAIAKLGNTKPPSTGRNEIETSNHNSQDDEYIVGIRRHGTLGFNMGFLPGNGTHDHLTGLYKSVNDGMKDSWRIVYPDGTKWEFDGYVTSIEPDAPVDDKLSADVTIRPTGAHVWTAAS
jgi:hypothetical protein